MPCVTAAAPGAVTSVAAARPGLPARLLSRSCALNRGPAAPRLQPARAQVGRGDEGPGAGERPAAPRQAGPSSVGSSRRLEADPELLEVLELATDEELEELHTLLHGRSLFSPLLKSLVTEGDTNASAAWSGREALIRQIDRRLRFLAADSRSTLGGQWPAYRQVLLNLRDKLGIRCPPTLLTNELEAEVFLHLLEKHADAVDVAGEQPAAAAEMADMGDGSAGERQEQRQRATPGLLQRLLAPLRLGTEEVAPALARLGGAVAVSNLQTAVLQQLGGRLMASHIRYEAALSFALSAGTKGVQGSLKGKLAVQAAQKGITAAASRYAAARTLLGLVGPVLWATTALELLYVSIGTDWSRVVKAVFALAQIRLLRTHGFSAGGASTGGSSPSNGNF